jgi:eukaryotic-like serine/threonine-protein kinase
MATVHLGQLLGEGGFARTVAIKRLHPQFAGDESFASMFLDEARLAARIRHPNVVPTLDVVSEGGELFLVMDLVMGESLSKLCRLARNHDQRIPPGITVGVVAGALYGLHAAHEATDEGGAPLGIVHRDVSPQNILVSVDGVPRVIDFGIAKAAGQCHTTREGVLKGKIPYMSPEQIHGTGVDRRTDIYAAGVVLWETLTGRRLFRAENEASVLAMVLEGASSPPSAVEPSSPRGLDKITMRALSRNPKHRYATAREMAVDLERAFPGAPARDIGEWVADLARDTLRQNEAAIANLERLYTPVRVARPPAIPQGLSEDTDDDTPFQSPPDDDQTPFRSNQRDEQAPPASPSDEDDQTPFKSAAPPCDSSTLIKVAHEVPTVLIAEPAVDYVLPDDLARTQARERAPEALVRQPEPEVSLSHVGIETAPRSQPSSVPAPRRLVPTVIGLSALAVVVVWLVVSRLRAPEEVLVSSQAASSQAASSEAAPPSTASSPLQAASSGGPSEAASPTEPTEPTEPPASAAAHTASAPALPASKPPKYPSGNGRVPGAGRKAGQRADCSAPYVKGPDGILHVKPECL